MEDRLALEEAYRWIREGGPRRSMVMVGPDAEEGWIVTLSDGSKRRTDKDKSFTALMGRLMEAMR